jgi:enoyl-CoA hydratase/carnithine racemase
MDLSVLCDFRIASANAIFGHPEIKFGAPPLFTPLQWIVGVGVARELCLTGRRIDAHEALRIGLVNSISEPERLLDDAMAMARTIIEAPQAALECTKGYLISSPSATFEEAFAVEHDAVFDKFLQGPVGPRTTS